LPRVLQKRGYRYENDHSCHSDFVVDWRSSNLAIQYWLGILSERRARAGVGDRDYPGLDGSAVKRVSVLTHGLDQPLRFDPAQ
jgi:hypothetical protein